MKVEWEGRELEEDEDEDVWRGVRRKLEALK
jgi:hypothetical protein